MTALQELCQRFDLLRLSITVQLQRDTQLPAFKGAMWHGWLGHALKQMDERAFHICFGEHDNRQPKPYAVCPGPDLRTHYRQGELLQFELSLYGEAASMGPLLVNACQQGTRLGLGLRRTPFSIVSIASHTPQGLRSGLAVRTLADWLEGQQRWQCPAGEVEFALQLHTPLRLKLNNRIVRGAQGDLNTLSNHLLRRLIQLGRFWVLDNDCFYDHLYREQKPLPPHEARLIGHFEDWQRYSERQQEYLPFGGLLGQLSYFGEIGYSLPLLSLAEQLQLGSKTSFGLGKVQLIY